MAPRFVALVNQKGGVGKTSLAVHLAAAWHRPRRPVVLLDLDPQRSATRWAGWGDGLPFPVRPLDYHLADRLFRARLDREAEGAALAVLDCPPGLPDAARVAAHLADLVAIPAGAAALDLWATAQAVELAHAARRDRGGDRPGVVLVPAKVISRTTAGAELPDALASYGEPVSPVIHQRQAWADAATAGGIVPRWSPAWAELRAVARYLEDHLPPEAP